MSTTSDVAFAFDTHKFIKQMVATGFTEEQAEVQVRLLSEILHAQLSTKADVATVDLHVLELKRDIETTRAELKRDIETSQVKLTQDIEAIRAKLTQDIETSQVKLAQDIEAIRAKLTQDIETTRAKLTQDIETTRAKLTQDTETTRAKLTQDIETIRAELKRDMKEMELRMVIKMGAMILASVGMMIGYLRAFPMPVHIVSSPAQEMRQMAPSPAPQALPAPPFPAQPAR
ncbi:MAG: apolipoprotein A1/A4/E family protein [Magnetococcales bacterium]|nr:apolipoprotein A1/A4/E family protein [Magnetococcales bacterium]